MSSAVNTFTSDELVTLLAKSQSNNSKVGITGLLVHKEGKFMQLLEGPEKAVRATIKKIEPIPGTKPLRHSSMDLLMIVSFLSGRWDFAILTRRKFGLSMGSVSF